MPMNNPSAVSGAGNPEAFLWAGAAMASAPGASASLAASGLSATLAVTAGSGITSLSVRFEVSNDGTTWVGVSTVRLTAPGSAGAPLGLPYAYVRANVIVISGGSVSAKITRNVTPVAAPASGSVGVNPVYSGIPIAGPYTLAQWAIPIIYPSSGTIGSNGALTLTTALPETYSAATSGGCWMFFPAGAVYSGSTADVYYVIMSSTTAGGVYNVKLGYGVAPYVPSAPAAVSGTGTSYTQLTSDSYAMLAVPILPGSLGPNGILQFSVDYQVNNNANLKLPAIFLSPTINTNRTLGAALQLTGANAANTVTLALTRKLRARAGQASLIQLANTSAYGGPGIIGNSPVVSAAYDMAAAQTLTFSNYMATATDYLIIQGCDIQVTYGE